MINYHFTFSLKTFNDFVKINNKLLSKSQYLFKIPNSYMSLIENDFYSD